MPKSKLTRTLTLIGVILIICVAVINLPAFLSVGRAFVRITLPVIVGLCIAFVLNIPLTFLEKLWDKLDKHSARRYHHTLKRIVCMTVCVLGTIGIILLFFFTVTPHIERSLSTLFASLPDFLDKIEAAWASLSERLSRYSVTLPQLELDAQMITSAIAQYFSKNSGDIIDMSIGVASSVVTAVFDVILAVVISIYVLAKKERLRIQTKRLMWAFLPEEKCRALVRIASLASATFAKFLTSQVTEAFILGAMCFAGMLLFGFPYAALISLIVGVTALIPIFGAFIGIAVGALLILLTDPVLSLWFVVFITVLQQIETNLIYPRLVGRSVGLPALWVLIAVTVGSSFGIVGMLVSVPAVSIIYCLVGQLVNAKLEKKLSQDHEEPQ